MKLQFKNQPYQTDAVHAVVNLFKGQSKETYSFGLLKQQQVSLFDSQAGVGN